MLKAKLQKELERLAKYTNGTMVYLESVELSYLIKLIGADEEEKNAETKNNKDDLQV